MDRRQFLLGGVSALALLNALPARAWNHGSAAVAPTGKAAQVNLNIFDTTLDFPFINTLKGAQTFQPRGGTPTGDFWADLNSDGYPTAIATGSSNWTAFASCYLINDGATFTGSISGNTLSVSGVTGTIAIGQTVQTISGSGVALATRITAGSGTSWTVSGSPQTVGSTSMNTFIPWVLDWSGNAIVSAGDTFAANLGTSGINVPFPGTQITANRLEYQITTTSGLPTGAPINIEVVIGVVRSTPSNMRFYRQDQEAILNAGQTAAPHFVSYYGGYGRLRFMNWLQTNGCGYAQWNQRPLLSNFGYNNMPIVASAYCGQASQTNNDYTCPNTLAGSPTTWTDGMMVQTSFVNNPAACTFTGTISNGSGSAGNTLAVASVQQGALAIGQSIRAIDNNGSVQICTITAGSGSSWTVSGSAQLTSSIQMLSYTGVTGFATGTTTTVTAPNHGFANGAVVFFPAGEIITSGGTGIDVNLFGNFYTVASATTNTFVLSGINSTGWGTYVSGGIVAYQVRVKTSTLPFKQVISAIVGSLFEGGVMDSMNQGNNIVSLIYDATFDKLLYKPNPNRGIPIEAACNIANDCNINPWINVPHLSVADAGGSFWTQMATVIKATLNPSLQWCVELSNEVWNSSSGFDQTNYAQAKGEALWSITDPTTALCNWYGWKFYNVMTDITAVYSGSMSRIRRIFAFQNSFITTSFCNLRMQAPSTGVAAFPITLADAISSANYFGADGQIPQAVDVYNYKEGVATSNPTLIAAAFASMDSYFTAPWGGSLTAGISNGSGGAGTILNVTAFNASGQSLAAGSTLDFNGVATGTVITGQLSGPTGGIGTYSVNISQLVAPGTNLFGPDAGDSGEGLTLGTMRDQTLPFWLNIAATNGGLTYEPYEGGWGPYPFAQNAPTSYNPGTGPVSLSQQDMYNLLIAYQASSNYATSFAAFLAAFKAKGGLFFSQFCMTSGTPAAAPSQGGMFGLDYPDAAGHAAIFSAAVPAKASFDAYNAA